MGMSQISCNIVRELFGLFPEFHHGSNTDYRGIRLYRRTAA
jgi:hypothetical protein